jgi:EmrB/QacA subfamily drug resistance transporter
MLKLEYKWLVGIVFVVALFMDLLDITVTNVAIPTLATEFDASTTTIEWVITGYLISLAVFIPISGWLGDRFGTKIVFVSALSLFIVASLLCGLAWNVESLIAFRVIQGIGGGMLTPVGTTMLFRAFPPSERAAASAVLAIPITIAPALGPILGGYLVEYQEWRWIFYINVPIGIVGLIGAIVLLREEKMANTGSLDVPGFVLGAAGLVSVVYALAEAGHRGFDDPRVIAFGLGGLAILGLFTWVELRTKDPMLDVRLLTDKLFGAANVIQIVGNASIMGSFFLLPLFLQAQKGLSPLDAGLATFPMALGVATMAQPAAKLYPKLGPRKMMIAGFIGQMVLTMALALVDYDTSSWWIAANMYVRGMFFGLLIIPIQAATFATIKPEDTGRASSIFSVSRQVAASLGVAIMATVLTNRLAHHDAFLGDPATEAGALLAFQDAFIFAGAMVILGILTCFLIDDEKAAQAARAEHMAEEAGVAV